MRRALALGSVFLLLGSAIPSGVAQGAPQKTMAMADLTVPPDRLPEGCALGSSAQRRFMGSSEITTNPWTGTDRRILQALFENIMGVSTHRPLPDAIFITPGQEAAFRAKAASGVVEGYVASYRQQFAKDLTVEAIRFAEAPERPFDGRNPGYLDIGVTRIQLTGDAGACSKAIDTYLTSLAN